MRYLMFSFICLLCTIHFTIGIKVILTGGTSPVAKNIKLGVSETLRCELSSPGLSPSVQWYYQKDKNSGNSGPFIVHNNELQDNFKDEFVFIPPANLRFNMTKKDDSGFYKCRAENPDDQNNGADEGVYDVTIVYPPSKPFCSYPSDKTLTRGYEMDLKCSSAEGVPNPQYSWYKDGKLLPTESSSSTEYKNASFSYTKDVGTLRFLEVNDANAGVYYCNASNSEGWKACNSFTLYIADQNVGQIVGIVFGVIIALALIGILIFFLWKRGFFSGGNDKDEDYMYDMAEEGNDVMLDGEGPHVTKAPSDVGSTRPESSMMI